MSAVVQMKKEMKTMCGKVETLKQVNKELETQHLTNIEQLNKQLELVKKRNKEIEEKHIIENKKMEEEIRMLKIQIDEKIEMAKEMKVLTNKLNEIERAI